MILWLLFFASDALFVPFAPGSTECYGIRVKDTRVTVRGSFEVSGASEGVRASMKDPTGLSVWSSSESHGNMEIKVTTVGKYELCFVSIVKDKQVLSFDIRVANAYDQTENLKDAATKSETEKVSQLVQKLETRMLDIQEQQRHGITREQVHRDTAENTHNRVIWWTVAKVLALAVTSTLQVLYLRSFFESKQII